MLSLWLYWELSTHKRVGARSIALRARLCTRADRAGDVTDPGGDVLRRAVVSLSLVGERVERLLSAGPVLAPSSAPPASRCPTSDPQRPATTRRRIYHSSAEMITIGRVHSPVLTARDSLTLHCGINPSQIRSSRPAELKPSESRRRGILDELQAFDPAGCSARINTSPSLRSS